MKTEKQHQPFSEIPSSILWDILCRLPIKTCLACKLVCKQWYHVVVNPEFSSLRSHCYASRFTVLFYKDSGDGGGTSFDLVELQKALDVDDSGNCIVGVDDLVRVQPKVVTSGGICGIWYLRSHCNGVFCLESVTGEYIVCNLLTGEFVNVQNLHELKKKCYTLKGCELGCCPVTGQFKVLMLLYDPAYMILLAKIQTLGNGEWRTVGNAHFWNVSDGCFLNGSSHWCGPTCIWSFHFGKEEFLQIPLPDDIISAYHEKTKKILTVLDSCLCLGCFSRNLNGSVEMDVWIMKEYGVRSSWVKQFVIASNALSEPLVQMDKGKILVTTGYKLYLYDPQTQDSKRVKFDLKGLSNYAVPFAAFDARFFRF